MPPKPDASSAASRKRKADDNTSGNNDDTASKKPKASADTTTTSFQPMSLVEIRSRIVALMDRVPSVDGGDILETDHVVAWAAQLQAVIEEFNLLVGLISPATYRWGSDRSGAADQNLSVLSGELAAAQEQISTAVTPRLTNVLAPVVDLVVDKTVITVTSPDSKSKEKQNFYTQKLVDPEFVTLCKTILGRNAKLIRQVCLANFNKVSQTIKDFLQAQEKDSQHDSRGFAY